MAEHSFEGIFRRLRDAKLFTYKGTYSDTHLVPWRAQVFLDGVFKGEPAGTLLHNAVRGEYLRAMVIDRVHYSIDGGVAIAD
jgi:hypothetical protein